MTLVRAIFVSLCFSSCCFAVTPNFTPQTIDGDIQIGYGLSIGEVDGDGKTDVLLADKREIVWYKNPGAEGQDWKRFVMARNLTKRDNVCLSARDIDGDGKVEVAVGAQWNPGETTDPATSGALFYLSRPKDPQNPWEPKIISPHDPTTHRMHWIRTTEGKFGVAVLPLHGRGNRGGNGDPVRLAAYFPADDSFDNWDMKILQESMHMTHNFDLTSRDGRDMLLVAGKEGIETVSSAGQTRRLIGPDEESRGAGEVRLVVPKAALVAIEPMHGNEVALYTRQDGQKIKRTSLDQSLNQGHALAAGDLLKLNTPQIVAGWRDADSNGKVGIKIYVADKLDGPWTTHIIDDNQMACEDLKLVDLDSDGKLDIVAAGRATKNVIVYWNRSE